ncbi:MULTISPECIES: cell division protein FtsB [Shewanella]|uniref:cell division protein FtsB n=1 Tax=Shewanella TaxID=22 RepID=UPI003004D1A3
MKRLLFVIVLLLGLLQYRLWQGENSLPEYFHLEQQIAAQNDSNARLEERNQVLKEEIRDLRSGTEALEERARNELGLIKKGETFYRVVGGEQRSMSLANQ